MAETFVCKSKCLSFYLRLATKAKTIAISSLIKLLMVHSEFVIAKYHHQYYTFNMDCCMKRFFNGVTNEAIIDIYIYLVAVLL